MRAEIRELTHAWPWRWSVRLSAFTWPELRALTGDIRAWLAAGLQWAGLEVHPAPRAFQSFGEAWAYWEEVARGAGRLWLDKDTGQYRVATGG